MSQYFWVNFFYSLLPYFCSGYPRLASQELAFYHAYNGGWRNRCGISWPLPACHAIFFWHGFVVYIDIHGVIIGVLLLCHVHSIKCNINLGITLFLNACKESWCAWWWCLFKNCTASLVWLTNGTFQLCQKWHVLNSCHWKPVTLSHGSYYKIQFAALMSFRDGRWLLNSDEIKRKFHLFSQHAVIFVLIGNW